MYTLYCTEVERGEGILVAEGSFWKVEVLRALFAFPSFSCFFFSSFAFFLSSFAFFSCFFFSAFCSFFSSSFLCFSLYSSSS